VLTPKNIKAKTAVEYFKKGYYQSNARGELLGQGAQTLGVKGEINDFQVYENLIKGLTPDGSKSLSQREVDALHRKAAVDCTFAAPKSVSLCALVGGDSRLLEAHDQAVKKVLELMERDYATTRIGTGVNREVVKTGNMVIAKFNHIETRELDPHLHSHCLVMNMTQVPNGEWYSHLNDGIFRNQKLLGMMYQQNLAIEVQRLGYEVEWHEHGQFDIKGYTPSQLKDFSKRRQQILAVVGANASQQQKEWAQKKTRRDKELVSPEELLAKWQEAAKALGIEIVKPGVAEPELENEPVDLKVFSDAIAHCSQKRVAFRAQDIQRFILEHSFKTIDVEGIQPLIDNSVELIRLIEKNGVRYTTQTAVGLELDTIRLMQSGQKSVNAITNTEVVEAHLEQMRLLGNRELNQGQRQAVIMSLTTTDRVVGWQGVAGAGKTFALKEVLALASASGYVVKGFAPSSKASSVLGEELKAPTQTVARLLHSKLPEKPEPNQIWVVDEVGLLSASDAHRLLIRAEIEQARLILVGDTKQLSAVEAGAPFKSLQQAGMKTAYLTESRRQEDPELKVAVDLLAEGRIEEGFDRLYQHGCIETVRPDQKVEAIVKAYLQLDPTERASTLLLAGTHAERQTLTLALRSALQAEGSLGSDVEITQLKAKDLSQIQISSYLSHFDIGDVVIPLRDYKRKGLTKGDPYKIVGKTADRLQLQDSNGTDFEVGLDFKKTVYQEFKIQIAVGDRLMWKKNNQPYQQVNGQEVVVKAINGNSVEIQQLNGQTQTIDLRQPHHLDHAIVRTTYSSQGETADRVFIAADSTIGRESFYVAASRARHQLSFFTSDPNGLLRWAMQSKAQENPLELLRQQIKQQMTAGVGVVDEKLAPTTVVTAQPDSIRTQSPSAPIIKPKGTPSLDPDKLRHPSPIKLTPNQSDGSSPEIPASQRTTPELPKHPEWLAQGMRVYWLEHGFCEVEAISGAKLCLKLDNGLTENLLGWDQALANNLIRPLAITPFWQPVSTLEAPSPAHIDSAHWLELFGGSVIHPEIAALNFKSLQHDQVEQEHEAWGHLFYGDKLERSNTGRLAAGILRRFGHIEAGGWWCSAGVDPRSFKDLQPGHPPVEKLWGCYKPNTPRVDAEKTDKIIKYEHPLKTDLSIFMLKVPEALANRIYERAGVEPSASDRASGFWYCVWKHNIPITVTEGAKKAASLLSQGHAAIGLPGIYAGYRSKDVYGYNIVPRLHEELAVFATLDRQIKFCFDFETRPKTKRNIQIAISRTGNLLEQQGARVSVVNLLGPEKGVDDLIKARGPLAYEKQAVACVPVQPWVQQHRQQLTEKTSSPQRPILKPLQIQSESARQISQTNPVVESSSTLTPSPEQFNERSRQPDTINHTNQGNISTRTDHVQSRVNAGDIPRTGASQYRLEAGDSPTALRNNRVTAEFVAGVEGLSDAIRRTAELQAAERITGAIARVSRSIRDFKPPARRHSDLRSALERLHQGIRTQHHRTNELTAGLTTAVTRLHQQITADAQRQIDQLSSLVRSHAETRAIAKLPALAEAINRLQHQFAVLLEQKHRTRQQLKQTLSTVPLPTFTQVSEQLQSALANLDEQLSQQSVLINQINRLSEQEFLQLRQQVRAYFAAKPPLPPAYSQRQAGKQEMSQWETRLNQLWQQHSSLANVVEQMQLNPFRLWNKKYNEAFEQLEGTFKSIEHAIAQKDVCHQQLQQWQRIESEHRQWSSSPQTTQMRQIASVLKLPQMQSRLSDIQQELQRQAEVRRDSLQGQQRLKGRGR